MCLYSLVAVADAAVHLGEDQRSGRNWLMPANLAVAFSGSLFWPVDLAAQLLLAR